MRCGRISVEGEAEEIAVLPKPRSRQKHKKRPNPYSTRGLDKFESVCSELSTQREYIAQKTGVPEALVRFVGSKNGWIPVMMSAGEGIGKKSSAEGAARVSITGHVEKSNDVNPEHKHHHNSKAKRFRSVVSMDKRHSTRPERHVQGFDSFYRRTSPAMGYDASVGATVLIITLFCLVFYGPLCAILIWLYILPKFKKV